jgi:trk system potassium uptake protein TrkA
MKIIIIGAGEVGYYLAKRLIAEDHEVTIIEIDLGRYRRAAESLDAIVIQGSGSSIKALQNAKASQSDILIAVSGYDEVNILSCMLSKDLGVKRCIARIRNPEYQNIDLILNPQKLGIDLLIHPERIAADEIIGLIERSSASKVVDFENGRLQIMALQILEDSPIINLSVKEVIDKHPDSSFLCLCIHRGEQTIIPHGNNLYQAGDIIYLIARREDIAQISEIVGYVERNQQNIMILGAGNIGRIIAKSLSTEMTVKLIEEKIETAEVVADELKDTLVLHGDGTDVNFLISERISEMDCFVAVTGNEKTNLLSGLLAQYLGVERIILHMTTNEYLPIMSKIGIDAVVSKNIATVNAIMKYIRRGHVIAVSLFENIDAEAIEMIPRPDSKITQKQLADLKLPDDLIIGAIIHQSEIIIPTGKTQIHPNDKVVVFLKPSVIPKAEKLFN